ncbi:MAG TPA: universal stress protein, partial [Flavisolibacter sp.]
MADILVPFDFSKNATIALDQALLISAANNKKLEVLHITNDVVSKEYPKSWKYSEGEEGKIREKIGEIVAARAGKFIPGTKPKFTIKIKQSATISGGLIANMLQSGSKLLVMGTHGSSGMYDQIFGSNTAVMVNHSLFPVLVIPHNWKPVSIEKCIAMFKLSKLNTVSRSIKSWGKFFNSPVEAIQFTISREAEAG